jgi:hypothetical protein
MTGSNMSEAHADDVLGSFSPPHLLSSNYTTDYKLDSIRYCSSTGSAAMGLNLPFKLPPNGLQTSLSVDTMAMLLVSERQNILGQQLEGGSLNLLDKRSIDCGSGVPLFEAACQNLSVKMRSTTPTTASYKLMASAASSEGVAKDANASGGNQVASLTLSGSILVDCFNIAKGGWEPVLEPWLLKVSYEPVS